VEGSSTNENDLQNEPVEEFKMDMAEACAFKVHPGSEGDALVAQFKALYHRAKGPPQLPSPWPQVAAYRLAHVKMRLAQTADDFQEAEELFAAASRLRGTPFSALGPMPKIYRTAALHRLAGAQGVDIDTVQRCRSEIARLFDALTRDNHGYESMAVSPERQASIQGRVYNYLELISYLTGTEYRLLAGMKSPFGDLMLADDWLVLSSASNLWAWKNLRYSRELATAELEARCADREAGLLFEVGDPLTKADGRVWITGGEPVAVAPREILLLKKLCEAPHATSEELEQSIIAERDGRATNLSKVTYELKEALGPYVELDGKPLILRGTRAQPVRLNPAVRVLGMVHYRAVKSEGLPVREYSRRDD
jgi:hypothetical protein